MKDHTMFTPGSIKNLNLKNRFIRSATNTNTSDSQGYPTAETKLRLEELAAGNIALLITGATAINDYSGYYIMSNDKYIAPWQEITDFIHKKNTLIAMQLFHPGRQAIPGKNSPIIAPSAIPYLPDKPVPEAMTANQIGSIIESFAQACLRVKKSGFDAVQLHVAHGYLLSSFISPAANIRNDKYGGNTANRARIIVEIIIKTKELVGDDYPILVKMNVFDGLQNGINAMEALKISKILVNAGIDAIEVSGGTVADPEIIMKKVKNENEEAYFKEYAKILKNEIYIPVILVGGHKSFQHTEEIIKSGTADFISMCRPLICEPDLVKRWQQGNTLKSRCISCNACSKQLRMSTNPIHCILNKQLN